MNRTHKTIFNRRLNIWQVASEITRGAGKGGGGRSSTLLALMLSLAAGSAMAQVSFIDNETVTVPGTQPSPWNPIALVIGWDGTAALIIENGGSVSDIEGTIALHTNSTGTVTVTGAGSSWANSNRLIIGQAGAGTLTIENGGLVSSGYTTISNGSGVGTLNLNGSVGSRGVLATGHIDRTGPASIYWNGGILRAIGNEADFLQGFTATTLTIGSGGAFVDSNSYDIGISTALSGTGGLTKLGAGTLTLTGANGYAGGTTVSAGILQAGSANTFSSGSAVSIDTGATLDLHNFDQTIGSLAGSGEVTLGSSTLTSAILTTGGDGTSTVFSGVISGTGSLVKNGAGVQTLNGANTYTGGTTINGGTLAIGANGSLAATGAVDLPVAGAIFDISAGGNQTIGALSASYSTCTVELGGNTLTLSGGSSFLGTINGTGGLVKIGAGTQQTISANSYTGNTTVSAGTLQVLSYSQSANQVLGIGVRNNTDYGKLLAGTATFLPDAKIFVDVTGSALAKGQRLDGVISATLQLDASTFNVTDNSALFNFKADVNLVGRTVNLNIVEASSTNSGVYDAVVGTGNAPAAGAAHALDGIIAAGPTGGDMDTVVTALGQLPTQGDVGRAVTQTLPLLAGGVTQATLGMLGSFNHTLQDRFANLGAGTGAGAGASTGASAGNASGLSGGDDFANRHAWAKAFGSRANQDDRNGASGFSSDSRGMAFGADGELDRDTRLGVAYAYANSSVKGNTDLSGTQQRADVNSHLLAIYGSRSMANALQLDLQADIGRNGIGGTRHIDFGGLHRTASSSHASYSAHVGAALSKTLALSEATYFAPGVRVDYTWLRDRSYRESGADALNLNVDGNTTEALVITAEGRMRHALSARGWLTANLGIGYDAINDRGNIVSVYAGAPGRAFATSGIEHSPWMVSGGVGYTMQVNQGMQISLRYDVEGREDYVNQTASIKANWVF